MNYHISLLVFSSLCVGAFVAAGIWWCSCCRLQPATRNKITSDIKFVFHSSTIAMMHGPINIRFHLMFEYQEWPRTALLSQSRHVLLHSVSLNLGLSTAGVGAGTSRTKAASAGNLCPSSPCSSTCLIPQKISQMPISVFYVRVTFSENISRCTTELLSKNTGISSSSISLQFPRSILASSAS